MDKNLELIQSEINNLNILSKMNNVDEIIKRSTILIKKYPKVYVFYNFLGYSLEKKNQIYEAEAVFDKSFRGGVGVKPVKKTFSALIIIILSPQSTCGE